MNAPKKSTTVSLGSLLQRTLKSLCQKTLKSLFQIRLKSLFENTLKRLDSCVARFVHAINLILSAVFYIYNNTFSDFKFPHELITTNFLCDFVMVICKII